MLFLSALGGKMSEEANKTEEISEKEKINKTKVISIKQGSAYGVSDGFGLRYITPYALSLGATNTHIGFLTSIPSLIGNLSQLFTPKLIERYPRKKIVFYSILLQSLAWLFIIFIGSLFFIFELNSKIAAFLLVIIYTLLVLFGAFYGPAWNSWMKDIVKEKSGKYFGTRNRIIGTVALVSMLIAGFLLDYLKSSRLFLGFIIIFGIAFLSRSISAFLILKKYEPELKLEKEYYFSFWQFLKKMPKNNFGKFVIFVSVMQFATAIASPFFAVYMLKDLSFSYIKWITVTISSSLAALIFMPLWGKFADQYGNLKVIKLCGFLIPLIPLLWLISYFEIPNIFYYLILIEFFSGFVWAGFNLSAGNFIYDAVTRQRMALCVAYFNILQGIGVFIGASLGGIVSSNNFSLFALSPLLTIFLLSGILRFAAVSIFSTRINEVKDVKKFGINEAKERFSTLTPKRFWKSLDLNLNPRQVISE